MKRHFYILAAVLLSATLSLAAQRPTDKVSPLVTQPQEQLITVLKTTTDRKEKADACRQLSVIGDKAAVPVLVGMLADPELHHNARYALETMPSSSVDAALRDSLKELKGLQLVGVIGSIGVRRDTRAVKPLSALLTHADGEVAEAAARALGSIGNSDALKALQNALSKTSGALQLAVIEGYLRATEEAATRSARAGVAAYDKLLAMQGMPPHVRVAAHRGVILHSGSKAADRLEQALTSSDDAAFIAAIRSALEMRGGEFTRVLTAALPKAPGPRQMVIVQTLGARRDNSAINTLRKLVQSGDTDLRVAAVKAVAQIGAAESVPVLVEALTASERPVAQAARDGLAGLTIPAAQTAIMGLVRNSDPAKQALGVDLVGRRRMTSAMPELIAAANAKDASVRSAAYRRIGDLAGTKEVPGLLNAVMRGNDAEQMEAPAEALVRIAARPATRDEVTPQVVSAFQKANPQQRIALMPVLQASADAKSLAVLRSAVEDGNPQVKNAAIRTLADWPDASAAADLLKIARSSSDNSQKLLAFRGYLRLARESELSGPQKLQMIDEAAEVAQGPDAQRLVLSAYGDVPSLRSLRKVAEHLNDPALADEAGAAALRIVERLKGDDKAQARPILQQVAQSAKTPAIADKARKLLE